MHRCEEWWTIGANCPGGLLRSANNFQGGGGAAPQPSDEVLTPHKKSPARVPQDGFELERLVLIELNKRMTRREQTVDKLGRQKERSVQSPQRIPAFIVREAIHQGAQGRSLALWVAAAAAAGAVALRFGPAAADQIPKVVRSVRNMAGVSQAFPQGGGGLRKFNAAAALEVVLRQRLPGGGTGGGGDFFPGILG